MKCQLFPKFSALERGCRSWKHLAMAAALCWVRSRDGEMHPERCVPGADDFALQGLKTCLTGPPRGSTQILGRCSSGAAGHVDQPGCSALQRPPPLRGARK